MLLLGNWWQPLFLAAAVHVVDRVVHVSVPASTAIEFVPLPIKSVDLIVAIPAVEYTVEYILVVALMAGACLTCASQLVGTRPTVEDVAGRSSQEHVVAPITDYLVIAWSAVDDVLIAKATYLVIAVHSGQLVRFVGAREQTALGAARHVIRGIRAPLQVE